uniref:Uncharacterized protein n=1 Tax=Manihot esculenta TaxID=3983 RepID=A0A2C9V814_MANES
MAGLQYHFFPTDFYYPRPPPSTTTTTTKPAVVPMQTQKEDDKKKPNAMQEKENSRSLPQLSCSISALPSAPSTIVKGQSKHKTVLDNIASNYWDFGSN